MDHIDPSNDKDARDGVHDETPGYTPDEDTTYEPNDGTPENPDHGNETVVGGEAVGTGAVGDQSHEEVAEGNTAPHDH